MKKLLVALTMGMTLGMTYASQPQHVTANHPATTVHAAADAKDSIVAYSDTTSSPASGNSVNDDDRYSSPSFRDVSDPFELIGFLATLAGTGGVIVAIFFVLLCIITVLSPVIFLIVLIIILTKHRNRRYQIIETAMQTGQPLPKDMLKDPADNPDYLWRRGIRNISIGAGIMVFAIIKSSAAIIGAAAIILCYGAGQVIISRTTGRKRNDDEDDTAE